MIDSLTLRLGTEPFEDHQVRLGASSLSSETLFAASQTFHGRSEEVGNSSVGLIVKEMEAAARRVGRPAKSASNNTMISSTSMVKENDPSTTRNFGRVCVACKTSKTPLWRGGPQGPKSLCNACGIRYRKARRALAAAAAVAAAADSGGCFPGSSPFLLLDQKELNMKTKKQYCREPTKFAGRGRPKKLGISTFATKCSNFGTKDHKMLRNSIGLSKQSAFHRVLPKDEEDAAMLLMALSCGLVHL